MLQEQEEAEIQPDFDKFKKVSFELLDIGLHYGSQGVEKIASQPLYQKVDAMINIADKFDLVQKHGHQLYTFLDSKFKPIAQNVLFLFDRATNSVTSFIKVITTKQAEVTAYVKETYSQVSVTIEGTWMRLDFNEDGTVSADDLKSSLVGLYEFLRNFDVIETTTHIKGQLYNDAIRYMQSELRSEENKRLERKPASE